MMRTIKTRGLAELSSLRKRVRRQYAARKISKADFMYIDQRLDEIEARVITMSELNEFGKEEH
jgi:tetrahydromethanopterin S-methyltransferase subunit G